MKKEHGVDENYLENLAKKLRQARTASDKQQEKERIDAILEMLKKTQPGELLDEKTAVTGYAGKLTSEDPLDTFSTTKNSFSKIHTLKLAAGKIYQIDVTGDFDTLLRIENSKQQALLLNDDVNYLVRNLNSRVVFSPLKDDTFSLIVTSFEKGTVGKYTLKLTEVAKIGALETSKGELTKADQQNKLGKFLRSHKIQLEANRSYTLEVESTQFDTHITLYDPTGKKFAAANGGISPHDQRVSRIDFTPNETAAYVVVVTSARQGETGAYTLRVQGYGPKIEKK